MLLIELKSNDDPNQILQNIANHITGHCVRKSDCHSDVGNALMSGNIKNSDKIVILGQGKVGTHSIIIDSSGNIKVDSYQNRIMKYDPETISATYYATKDKNPKAVWELHPLKIVSVKDFRQSIS